MNSTNPLSNQSYLNKDFQTIYPELLDLIKKLSYKWDPTVSNESDPGVLLLKLNAIIADKNNYNIDKNLLECFPDSVTQDGNAYKLFSQLGYNMHWYKSAEGKVTMRWNSEKILNENRVISYTVPQFSMICDEDKENVFTLLNDVNLVTDGSPVEVDVIQGVIKDYTMGSTTLITPSFLDSNNRLYFPITNVAENGIFISDSNRDMDTGEYKFIWDSDPEFRWNKVDNLYIQAAGTKCYKFGIDQTTNSCYIEFPSDISDLMGEGIFVKYLQTNGKLGNVAVNRLTTFYKDIKQTSIELPSSQESRTISSDIKVWNVHSITSGDDPETIDDAYIGYQRQVGTFDTLITLADYLNYIVNEEFRVVSNGVVADRTNDIQSSYKIVTSVDDTSVIKPIVVNDNDGKPEMSPYDLKTYFLEYSDISVASEDSASDYRKATMKKDYDKSFGLKFGDSTNKLGTSRIIESYFSESKAIQHNFIDKLPNRPLFYKNRFALNLTIIPNSVVTDSQASEIEKNVYEALYTKLLSKNISFGEELTYEKIYDICNNADSRIKAVALDNIDYDTYAVIYVDDKDKIDTKYTDVNGKEVTVKAGINEILVSTNSDNWVKDIALEIAAKNVLAGVTPMYDKDEKFSFDLSHTNTSIVKDIETADTYAEITFTGITETSKIGNWTENESILDNEALIFYAPSLIEIASYATSVKYIYYTTTEYSGNYVEYLPANRDLILEKGQYVFVFWKNEDSKDSPYLYTKYGPGTILHSTTRLITSESDKNGAISGILKARGYEGEGQILGDFNDVIYEVSDTILTSSKVLTIKKINSAKLNDTRTDCYWITNHKGNDGTTYEMEFKFADSLIRDEVEASYQNGQLYIANFDTDSSFKPFQDRYSLKETEKIYILQPEQKTIQYTDSNSVTQQTFNATEEVTNYKVIKILKAGDVISCTGHIKSKISADDFIKLSNYDVGDNSTIPWGEITREDGKNYDTLSYDDLATAIGKDAYSLTNGYKIEKHTITYATFGEESEGTSIFTYRLKTNEYFLYTNEQKDSLYILEDGTTINIEVPNKKVVPIKEGDNIVGIEPIKLSVSSKLSAGSLYESDIDTFSSLWYTITATGKLTDEGKIELDSNDRAVNLDDGMILEIIENQIIKIGAGATVNVRQNPVTGKALNSEGEMSEINYFDERYNCLKINSDGVYTSTGVNGTWVNDPYALLQYEIRYKDKEETSYTSLTPVEADGLSWNAYMVLSISAGAYSPQKLDIGHKHKITVHTTSDPSNDDGYELSSDDTITRYIQTNYPISLPGGEGINLTAESIEGDIYYIDLYHYTLSEELKQDIESYKMSQKDNIYTLSFKQDSEFSCDLSISKLQSSLGVNMILPIKVEDESSKFSVKYDINRGEKKELVPVGYTSNEWETIEKVSGGTYYYKLPIIDTSDDVEIALHISGKSGVTLQLLPLFPFTYNNEISVEQDELETEISVWDKNKEFDYTYQPLADVEILNPLESKKFFNRNHICNKFVIPQISSITIKTMNKRS